MVGTRVAAIQPTRTLTISTLNSAAGFTDIREYEPCTYVDVGICRRDVGIKVVDKMIEEWEKSKKILEEQKKLTFCDTLALESLHAIKEKLEKYNQEMCLVPYIGITGSIQRRVYWDEMELLLEKLGIIPLTHITSIFFKEACGATSLEKYGYFTCKNGQFVYHATADTDLKDTVSTPEQFNKMATCVIQIPIVNLKEVDFMLAYSLEPTLIGQIWPASLNMDLRVNKSVEPDDLSLELFQKGEAQRFKLPSKVGWNRFKQHIIAPGTSDGPYKRSAINHIIFGQEWLKEEPQVVHIVIDHATWSVWIVTLDGKLYHSKRGRPYFYILADALWLTSLGYRDELVL